VTNDLIGNAKIAGLEKDLGLKGYDYNIVLTVFYISFIIFEIPSTLACKLVGPGWFIPSLGLGFGIISICTAFVHNKAQIAAVRFLLGVFESGINPSMAYYLSRWYRRSELAFRISLYMVMGMYFQKSSFSLSNDYGLIEKSSISILTYSDSEFSSRMVLLTMKMSQRP
jgi:MFS family permease